MRRCSGLSTRNNPPAPPRLTPEVGLALLVEQHHRAARIGELTRGDEAGEAGTHDDGVGIHWCTLAATLASAPDRPSDEHLVQGVRRARAAAPARPGSTGVRRRGRRPRQFGSSGAVVLVTATRPRHPGLACRPQPRHRVLDDQALPGSTPRRRAPRSHGSGHGFPRSTSDAVTTTGGWTSPVTAMRASAGHAFPDVTMAVGTRDLAEARIAAARLGPPPVVVRHPTSAQK